MSTQVSTALVKNDKNLLMVFDEVQGWKMPSASSRNGELSSDTAVRAVRNLTGCEHESIRYRQRLKTQVSRKGNQVTVQSYEIEIEGEPESGEWVHVSELQEKDLAPSVSNIKEKLVDRM